MFSGVELWRIARAQNEPARKVRQAEVLLALADGMSIRQVSREHGPTTMTVMASRLVR